jgi:ribosome-associated protein
VLSAPREADVRGRRESLATAKAAIAAALEKKAVEPVLIDVCGRASYADFIGVVSGRSDRQVDAIADGICEAMAERGRRPLGREGARNGRWVLIDFGDVVVHVFYHPLREVFDLESLWIDAPRVKLQIPAEARADARIDGEPGRDSLS